MKLLLLTIAGLILACPMWAQNPDPSKMKAGEMAVIKIDQADLDEIASLNARAAELLQQVEEKKKAIEAKHGVKAHPGFDCDGDKECNDKADRVTDYFHIEWKNGYLIVEKETRDPGGPIIRKSGSSLMIWR